jgi:hypothetical protein
LNDISFRDALPLLRSDGPWRLPMTYEPGYHRRGADSALAEERRVRVRHRQQLNSYAQHGAGDLDQIWWLGSVRNISENGIGLVIPHRFDVGTSLTLELENASRTFSSTLQVQVVRSFPEARGWYVGCTFAQELTADELRGLLA